MAIPQRAGAALIDRMSLEPLHEQVRKVIFEEIATGLYAPGDRIATEREYAERLGVSLAPVRAALAALVRSGHLARTQGRGTFVLEPKVQYALGLLASCTDSLREAGIAFDVFVAFNGRAPAPVSVAGAFGITPGAELTHLRRIVTLRGRAAILLESWLPLSYARRLGVAGYFEGGGSLYRLLEETGVALARSSGRLEFVRHGGDAALALPFGAPLFEISSTSSDPAGTTIEVSRGLYDADRFALQLDRSMQETIDE